MSQGPDEQLSALFDGELPDSETELLLARLDRDPERRRQLARYSMIGEYIRAGTARPDALHLGERVRTALAAEAAPRSRPARHAWLAGGIAAAAALAAVLIAGPVAWRADLQPAPAGSELTARLVDDSPALVHSMANRRLDPSAAARLTGYLVAHGEYANQFSRNNFDSHLVSARAERASWRQSRDLGDAR